MLFPRYNITEPWPLDDLIRIMYDSKDFDSFIKDVIATNDFPLGTFSCAITHPVNGKIVIVLVDAKQSRLVGMQVCGDEFDSGFIPIKHDRASLEQVVEDINNDILPLFNVCESDEVTSYQAYAGF
jgi:hypothetical protein